MSTVRVELSEEVTVNRGYHDKKTARYVKIWSREFMQGEEQ